MRITVISRSWPPQEHSGVSLAAAEHVRALADAGHAVSVIGADEAVLHADLPATQRVHVAAFGSGALYAPARIDRAELCRALVQTQAELVITEAWQTALTDAGVELASDMDLPVLMISHGISIDAFDRSLAAQARAAAWWPYARWRLPKLMRCLSAMTALDLTSPSSRFRDRDLGRQLGIPVLPCANSPVNWKECLARRDQRDGVVLVVGYYSAVKNQLGALEVAARLRPHGLRWRFVGPRRGAYFDACRQRSAALGLEGVVEFLEDHECALGHEISHALAVLAPSLTEALPVTLIEASASGTPFVATPVGAVPSMHGGVLASGVEQQARAIERLLTDITHWSALAGRGRLQFESDFREEVVRASLLEAVRVAVERGPRR